MSTVIKVENLSKQYRLGQVGTGSLAHDINRAWHRLLRKEDPYLKIGAENDRTAKGNSDYVWALRDINFNVAHGEVLGIIGRNGAGKSTLLKILSRTTAPTTGKVKIKGRVASLLEVGTGFHPELSGRDNIFLNGAILGMSKAEIKRKFDEMVDFAGVERYIDTPVKRYSSGMYVRLAFAVAAHLEPEILIVDEVLAVGDAEFQKKALGKMKDVSKGEGRTVLFVSHNIEAILQLCAKCLLLEKGKLVENGLASKVIDHYLTVPVPQAKTIHLNGKRENESLKQNAVFRSISLENDLQVPWSIKYKTPLTFVFEIELTEIVKGLEIGVAISTNKEVEVVTSLSTDSMTITELNIGVHRISYSFESLHLLPGIYNVGIGMRSDKGDEDYVPFACSFEIQISDKSAKEKSETRKGILVPSCSVVIQ